MDAFIEIPILLIADLLQPRHGLPFFRLDDGDVRHAMGRASAMPMLDHRGNPNLIARLNALSGLAPALHQAHTGRDDQGLPAGVGMPCRSCPRCERDGPAAYVGTTASVKSRINAYGTDEVLGPTGHRRLRAWMGYDNGFGCLAGRYGCNRQQAGCNQELHISLSVDLDRTH